MSGFELFAAVLFYIVFSLFGAIGFPGVSRFITGRTLAYVAAKPAGLLLFGYFIWILSYFRLLNYQNKGLVFGAFALAVLVGGYLSYRILKQPPEQEVAKSKKAAVKPEPMTWYKKILWLEAVTLGVLLVYLYLRSFNAAINGTERFMDLALLTASGKTEYFPFIDPWYAGKTVNYYYYGSYLMSLVSNLSNIPYLISYNIALGILYCQSAVLSAALVYTKTRSKFFALFAAFLITSAGTLFYSSCALKEAFVPNTPECSYASSTRLFDPSYIINEIPSYSFTVGDLHAHVLALPFFLFVIILMYALHKSEKPPYLLLGLIAVSIASMWMINAWDAVTSGVLFGMVLLSKVYRILDRTEPKKRRHSGVWNWVGAGLLTSVLAGVLMLPNLIGFQSPVLGLYFIPSYVAEYNLTDVQWPTPFSALLGMWGVFLVVIAWGLFVKRRMFESFVFPFLLSFVALGIIIGVELFFVQDIYGVTNPPYFRANTTFKFGFHAWSLLSIAVSMVLAAFVYKQPQEKMTALHRWAWLPITAMLLGGLFYPYKAINQFYLAGTQEQGLDGSLWMKQGATNPDRETIQYINKNFNKRAVIAEAIGDSYSTHARIASYTGMITPMGWKTHEWTWRFDAKAGERAKPGESVETGYGPIALVATEIQRMYETSDAAEAKVIIDRYGIEYIYIGAMEHAAYPNLSVEKFSSIAEPIFTFEQSTLYKVR